MKIISFFLLFTIVPICHGQSRSPNPTTVPQLSPVQLSNLAIDVLVQIRGVSPTNFGYGSGVWLTDDGLIATCAHVLLSAAPVRIDVGWHTKQMTAEIGRAHV